MRRMMPRAMIAGLLLVSAIAYVITAMSVIKSSYNAIYLSPHFDDAVLSCGGQIAARTRNGESVLIVTLTAGEPEGGLSPVAQELHNGWQREDVLSARREEDRMACRALGADWLHVAVPDGIYRRHPQTGSPLYPSLHCLFKKSHPDDGAESCWIETLQGLPTAQLVMAPLAVGGHADHRLARSAAEGVFGQSLWYYEDFPYAKKWGAVPKTIWPPWHWRSQTIQLAPDDLNARCKAAAIYTSQIAMLQGNRAFHQKVERYVRKIGGERIWQKR